MANSTTLAELLSWNNPLAYFIVLLIAICVICAVSIIKINRIMTEQGIQFSYDIFGSNIRNILKWTSKHETKTGILMFIIIVLGVIAAVNFKAN